MIPEQSWRVPRAEQGEFIAKQKDHRDSQYLGDIENYLINLVKTAALKVESVTPDSCLHASSRKEMIWEYQTAIVSAEGACN